MTVKELIEQLEQCNPNARIRIRGTDYLYDFSIKKVDTGTVQPKEVADKILIKVN